MVNEITIKELKKYLNAILVFRNNKEVELDTLRRERDSARKSSDLYKVDQIDRKLRNLPAQLKGVDDAIASLEPLFKLTDPLDPKKKSN